MMRHGSVPALCRRRPHKGALANAGFNQSTALRLDVAARDRCEVHVETAGKLALWREPVGGRKRAVADVFSDGVCDGEITRFTQPRKMRRPVDHFRLRNRNAFRSTGTI